MTLRRDVASFAPCRARDALLAAYPGYDYPVFLRIGMPAVFERLAAPLD